jgi:hypothetical protein
MRKRQIEQMVDKDINDAELENEMTRGLEIDFETADRITVCCLKEQLQYLRDEQLQIESLDSVPGHKQADYFANRDIINALEKVVSYYGG